MTLNTTVYILSETDPHEVFFKCRELLGAPDDLRFFDEPASYPEDDPDPKWDLRNPGGVGLGAWLWMHYKPGAMYQPTHVECDGDICDSDCDGKWYPPAYWFDVTFDTAYGYADEQGRGCGVYHASLVADLGGWLDERGVRWAWQNEFTGEIHIGDRYERLFDLFEGGDEAERWMREIVRPAIERAFGIGGAP